MLAAFNATKSIFSSILTKDGIEHPNLYPNKANRGSVMHKHLRFRFQKRTLDPLDQITECYRQDGLLQLSNSNMKHQKHLFFARLINIEYMYSDVICGNITTEVAQ